MVPDKKISNQIAKLPHLPGVYLFYDCAEKLLYVGKSGSLRTRVQSYFRADFAVNNAAKQAMIPKIARIKHRVTDSEIEALILEASLIKKLKPKFNRLMRDDKSYRWVAITKETFPKVFSTHQPRSIKLKPNSWQLKTNYIGPFTEGLALKDALRALRRIFPYCTCKTSHARPCLNAQLGLCLGYCCTKTKGGSVPPLAVGEYSANIRNLKKVLMGGKRALVKGLEKRMKEAAAKRHYEKATRLRNKVAALNTFLSHRHVLRQGTAQKVLSPKDQKRASRLKFNPLLLGRVECYDISNIQGQYATASMVVFSLGEPAKSEYRHFKIRFAKGPDDYAMLKETLVRRLKHSEWPRPELIVIDGGLGQRGAVAPLIKRHAPTSILVALAKREEILYTSAISESAVALNELPQAWANFFMHIRDEAHRFALKYHRHLRDKKPIT